MQREQRFSLGNPVLFAALVFSAALALWLAIVLFGGAVLASQRGEGTTTTVVLSGSLLACGVWWAAREIVRLGFRATRQSD
jgi:hypothetical protein